MGIFHEAFKDVPKNLDMSASAALSRLAAAKTAKEQEFRSLVQRFDVVLQEALNEFSLDYQVEIQITKESPLDWRETWEPSDVKLTS